ncbi:unnamed protein product, partial [Polarella glacialis]
MTTRTRTTSSAGIRSCPLPCCPQEGGRPEESSRPPHPASQEAQGGIMMYSTTVPAGVDLMQTQGLMQTQDSYSYVTQGSTSYQPRESRSNLLEAPSEQSGLIQSIKWYVYCFSFLPILIVVSFVFVAKGSTELDALELHEKIHTPHPRVFLLSCMILLYLTAFFCSIFQ